MSTNVLLLSAAISAVWYLVWCLPFGYPYIKFDIHPGMVCTNFKISDTAAARDHWRWITDADFTLSQMHDFDDQDAEYTINWCTFNLTVWPSWALSQMETRSEFYLTGHTPQNPNGFILFDYYANHSTLDLLTGAFFSSEHAAHIRFDDFNRSDPYTAGSTLALPTGDYLRSYCTRGEKRKLSRAKWCFMNDNIYLTHGAMVSVPFYSEDDTCGMVVDCTGSMEVEHSWYWSSLVENVTMFYYPQRQIVLVDSYLWWSGVREKGQASWNLPILALIVLSVFGSSLILERAWLLFRAWWSRDGQDGKLKSV